MGGRKVDAASFLWGLGLPRDSRDESVAPPLLFHVASRFAGYDLPLS